MLRSSSKWCAIALAGCLLPPKPTSTSSDAPAPGGDHNVVENGRFEGGRSLPWTSSFTAPGNGTVSAESGELCTEITNQGVNNWDAQVRLRGMNIQHGHHYRISFRARASAPTTVRPKVGTQGAPYAEYWFATLPLGTQARRYAGTFTMDDDDNPTAELAFHMGGPLAGHTPVTVCIDDVVLEDPQFVRTTPAGPPVERIVHVDQLGYLPIATKVAVIHSDSKEPIAWAVRDRDQRVVASGTTTVFGDDKASGDHVHHADFSSVREPGAGYQVVAAGQASEPFDIKSDLYRGLARDALRFFFHNRSGIAIAMPFAGEKRWARPAGHTSDSRVPCLPGTCNYTLDVAGGWYDAGDHGKYVVNGGIAVWTLLDQYERATKVGAHEIADGALVIPESKNGVSDELDEARWELEFMLKMQVPDGQPLAGMVHHKIHDENWTAIPTAPHEAKQRRYLHPPSTAATLNVAAVAAQAARIYSDIDPAFAKRCLAAAERAWAAAARNPARFASNVVKGGGPYDDNKIADEQYWAAAELFVTTGKDTYRTAVTSSPYAKTPPTDGMTWDKTAAMGMISLALSDRDHGLRDKARADILAAAKHQLAVMHEQGYRVPFGGEDGNYPWGSSSYVLNNAILIALAHDFTGEAQYREGVTAAMDYLLGTNPLGISYITGYGEHAIEHPHHRFWAHQADPKYPAPPPGLVSGGPNSQLQDPYVQAAGMKGCAPQRCFQDHIESYSTNEVAINWNAALAWVAGFLSSSDSAQSQARKP